MTARPQLVRVDDAVYLDVPTDGEVVVRWHVYWVHYGPPLAAPHKRRRLGVGDRRANYLWFVGADGAERIARLDRDADRSVTAEVLAGYLARAGVPASPPR